MKFQFYTINALNPHPGQELLNVFCASHSLISIEKHFVPAGLDSYWVFCVQYNDHGERITQPKRDKIDYREVLNEDDFALYSKLRSLRKTLAEKEGVPVYSLFTNEQLATMVRERITTEISMFRIDGVGKARMERYGGDFLTLLQAELAENKSDATNEN